MRSGLRLIFFPALFFILLSAAALAGEEKKKEQPKPDWDKIYPEDRILDIHLTVEWEDWNKLPLRPFLGGSGPKAPGLRPQPSEGEAQALGPEAFSGPVRQRPDNDAHRIQCLSCLIQVDWRIHRSMIEVSE